MDQKKRRLLFTDDDLLDRPYLVIPFEEAGLDVDIATNGKDAWDLLLANQYDAVIVDNMMPGGGGVGSEWSQSYMENLRTGLRLLRKMNSELEPKPPTWVLTALPDSDVRQQEEAFMFVVEYIPKPYSLRELGRKIMTYLNGV